MTIRVKHEIRKDLLIGVKFLILQLTERYEDGAYIHRRLKYDKNSYYTSC